MFMKACAHAVARMVTQLIIKEPILISIRSKQRSKFKRAIHQFLSYQSEPGIGIALIAA